MPGAAPPIYLDSNATTRPAPEVVEAMLPLLRERFGNPSSLHGFGSRVRGEIDRARERVAALLGADPAEIVFTSGGTESIAGAIRGALALGRRRGARRVVTTAVEHPAVRAAIALAVEAGDAEATVVPVDAGGALDLAALERALGPDGRDVALCSVMWANNETGILFPVAEVAALCRARSVPLHVDAVQAAGKVAIEARGAGLDLLSISGHKLHGPKGIGALYIRRGLGLPPLQPGGGQEGGRRGGTENVPGIAGLGVACALAAEHLAAGGPERIARLRDRLEARLLESCPGARRNGAADAPRTGNTTSLRFPGVDGAGLVLELSREGVAASSGSACASGSLEPSPALLAMGIGPEEARGALRLSLSRETTEDEVDRAAAAVAGAVRRLGRIERRHP